MNFTELAPRLIQSSSRNVHNKDGGVKPLCIFWFASIDPFYMQGDSGLIYKVGWPGTSGAGCTLQVRPNDQEKLEIAFYHTDYKALICS